MTADRLADRATLLGRLDRGLEQVSPAAFEGSDASFRKALDLIRSAAVRRAFELDREPPRTRERYGPHLFGQGCLLARRLLEAGRRAGDRLLALRGAGRLAGLGHAREQLPPPARAPVPPTDRAVSRVCSTTWPPAACSTTRWSSCMGEFGRTPKINKKAGRDHWPQAQSILLAGAGRPAGSVYGSSDRDGGYPPRSRSRPPT